MFVGLAFGFCALPAVGQNVNFFCSEMTVMRTSRNNPLVEEGGGLGVMSHRLGCSLSAEVSWRETCVGWSKTTLAYWCLARPQPAK